MSESYVSAALRRLVISRAARECEYCLLHEDDTFFGCHVDHIISEKHGGQTTAENLALACAFCNLHKGSDLASLTSAGHLCRLFHPRRDHWNDHFFLDGAFIEPRTDVGQVTANLLKLNAPDRLLERRTLIEAGLYPSRAART